MKLSALLLLLTCSLFLSCKKDRLIPECIQSKVKEFKAGLLCGSGSSVMEYKFQGEYVYTFSIGQCGADLSVGVFDSNCVSIGYLGGFTGNTTIQGEEFSHAVYTRTIWSK